MRQFPAMQDDERSVPAPAPARIPTLSDVRAGIERAHKRVDAWPAWMRELSRPAGPPPSRGESGED